MQELFRRRNLPHWDVPNATCFVTCCLAGSIPAVGQLAIRRERNRMARQRRAGRLTERPGDDCSAALFGVREKWLDAGRGVRWLRDRRVACVVQDAMHHFADARYVLLAYVVMPSHVHWLFRPTQNWLDSRFRASGSRTPREAVLHAFRRHTALVCNRILGRRGPFWQHESYDRVVRDDDELQRTLDYIEFNPVKAGLCERPEDWEFSSAWRQEAKAIGGQLLGSVTPRGDGTA